MDASIHFVAKETNTSMISSRASYSMLDSTKKVIAQNDSPSASF